MKDKIKIVLYCLLVTCVHSSRAGDSIFINSFELTEHKNIFFSGHSLMDNPYADYLESISVSLNKTVNWNQQIGLGSPIRVRTSGSALPPNNWQGYLLGKNKVGFDMNVIQELSNPATIGVNAQYDFLIITERHDLFDTILWEYTNSLLRHYHDRLLAGNANAKTLFFHSWLPIDANNPNAWVAHESLMVQAWECVAEKVNLTLLNDGLQTNISVLPAGLALTNLVTRILSNQVPGFVGSNASKINQLFDDDVHLNAEGIFYMAAVSYATIFNESPVGAQIPPEIDVSTGQALLQIAWENVSQYRNNYDQKTMAQCRAVIENQICASYYNFTNRPTQIANCQTWIANNSSWQINPFNWPDPNLIQWSFP